MDDTMDDGPGLTCLYKDGEAKNFEGSEVEAMLEDGWQDTPQPKAGDEPEPEEVPKRKPGRPKLVKQD